MASAAGKGQPDRDLGKAVQKRTQGVAGKGRRPWPARPRPGSGSGSCSWMGGAVHKAGAAPGPPGEG